MEIRDQAFEDYKKGMKYKDIAKKYGVSLSAVKSWATRYWKNEKVATKSEKKLQPKKDKLQPKSRGAPKGNKNAVGNKGGGAPEGNKNNFKHGIYEGVYWDVLDDEEKAMLLQMELDEEKQLEDQIALLTVREHRIMMRINECKKQAKSGMLVAGMSVRKLNHNFATNSPFNVDYQQLEYNTQTTSVLDIITKLETALTQIQAKKTKCIDTLAKLRIEKERLTGSKGNTETAEDWIAAVIGCDEDG